MKNRKNPVPAILWTVVLALSFYIIFQFFLSSPHLEVAFIDVGQGDSAYIGTPSGKTVILDAGGSVFGQTRVGERVVGSYLIKRGKFSVDMAIASHYHADHVKGIIELSDVVKIKNFMLPDVEYRPRLHDDLVSAANQAGANVHYISRGQDINVDEDTKFITLFPLQSGISEHSGVSYMSKKDPNNDSLVLKLTYGNTSFLFTGDLESDAELALLEDSRLNSDVLKVGHHGSKTSTGQEFLEKVAPSFAVISVGGNNNYGHPHHDVLERLILSNAKTYRTDFHGTVTFLVDKSGIFTIKTSRN